MLKSIGKVIAAGVTAILIAGSCLSPAQAEGDKIGYVDLRRSFYEYEKQQNMEKEINSLTEKSQAERTEKIAELTKLRDETELLSGNARVQKQNEIDAKLLALQEFDRDTRQELLNRKNGMFREIMDDIQKVVDEMGKNGDYDYILDSRNVMYAKGDFDLTEQVIKQLNK